jgi:hypothetical protein
LFNDIEVEEKTFNPMGLTWASDIHNKPVLVQHAILMPTMMIKGKIFSNTLS